MEKTAFDTRYHGYLTIIEDYLNGLFVKENHWTDLYEAMRYSLLSGGKRLRPVMTLEFARLLPGQAHFYNLDGLTQMVEEEAEEFNATHTEATENPMNVKTVQALGDGAMVQVVQEFADTDSYAEYNEQDLFYGTRVEALAQGLTVNRELVNAADGTPADSEKLDKALEKNHLIITNASAYIYCPYPVLYISEGVVMGEDGYVDASQSDGVVTILMKK